MANVANQNRIRAAQDAVSAATAASASMQPTDAQRTYLKRGLSQPGGKLPLFDANGQEVGNAIVQACIDAGWAEPWFINPIKPDWLVCKLTKAGYTAVGASQPHAH